MSSTFEFVSVSDAARSIGVTVSRIRQMLRSGDMSGEKVNERAWAIPKSEVARVKKIQHVAGRPRSQP